MRLHDTVWIALAIAAGCGGAVHLKETTPVSVTGSAPTEPAPPRKPRRVEVKQDRIDVRETIQFDFSSSRISGDSDALLDEIAAVITKHAELKRLRIEGHTDNSGDAPHNLSLSKKRAAAVVKYLVGHGVAADRLVAEGHGDTKPIADNDTEEGRAKNRRVAFVIVERGAAAKGGGGDDDDDDDGGAP